VGGIRDPRPPGALCLTGKGPLPVEEAVNPNETALEVAWIASRSLPLRSLASSLVRRAMEALAKEPDVADVGLTPVPLGRAREPAEASYGIADDPQGLPASAGRSTALAMRRPRETSPRLSHPTGPAILFHTLELSSIQHG